MRIGSVDEFDDARGLGWVLDSAGRRWPFHCVSIVDGTRTIPVGIQVEFELAPRVLRIEAVRVRPAV